MEPARVTIRAYEDLPGLATILPAWEDLLAACPAASIFSTWEWLASWWEAFGGPSRLHVLAFWSGTGQLEALAPLAIGTESTALGARLSILSLMGDGSGDSDNLGFLVRPSFEAEFAEHLFDYLDRQSASWDIARFNTVDPDAGWARHAREVLARRRWSSVMLTRPWCVVPLPETWDDYLRTLSGKERRKIRTRIRRLERRYDVSFHRCGDERELPGFLDSLFALHARRWQQRGVTGSFGSEPRRSFYRIMGERFLHRGWLDLSQLRLNGAPAAVQFSFRYRNVEYSLQEGYDPEYSRDAVGYVLRAVNIRRLISEGVRSYDFLAGRDASKQRWGAEVRHYIDWHFARRPSLGAIRLSATRTTLRARRWLREHWR